MGSAVRPLPHLPQSRHAVPTARALRELPGHALRHLFIWLSHRRLLGRLAMRAGWTRRFVRRFVAGVDLETALPVIASLQAGGYLTLVDVLGEAVASSEGAMTAVDRYLVTLDALAAAGARADVSLKLTHLGLGVDDELCRADVRRVVERAAALGASVQIDMEDSTKTDPTFHVFEVMHASGFDVRIAVQAYLRRSADDVERLIEARARVRLCKGAYDEPASLAFPAKDEVDESYVRLMERLLARGVDPALATHDERLIDRAIERAGRLGLSKDAFEFQMLYGVRRDLQERLRREGYRVRLYVPYGTEWYPYYMRRLAERPANVLFILGSVVREGLRRA
jgi:proline dehydrogenase